MHTGLYLYFHFGQTKWYYLQCYKYPDLVSCKFLLPTAGLVEPRLGGTCAFILASSLTRTKIVSGMGIEVGLREFIYH